MPAPVSASRLEDDVVTVEAATAEEALEEVVALLGPDAKIVKAETVYRGGIAGFFAREMVRLSARRPGATPMAAPAAAETRRPTAPADELTDPIGSTRAASRAHTAAVRAQAATARGMTGPRPVSAERKIPVAVGAARQAAGGPVVFLDTLDRALADEDPMVIAVTPETLTIPSPPRPAPERPAVRPDQMTRKPAPPVPSMPAAPAKTNGDASLWGPGALLAAGLPFAVVERAMALRPGGDWEWIEAISHAVATMCGPLPQGPALLLGPHADRIAAEIDVPCLPLAAAAEAGGSVCPRPGGLAGLEDGWRLRARRGRWPHLVIGGLGWWDQLLDSQPLVVSWVGEQSLMPALGLAAARGITLGYGTFGDQILRADPLNIALAIRQLLGRR